MFTGERPAWQDPRVITLLVLVFMAGAMSGAIGMQTILHERLHARTELSYEKLKDELHLSPEQAEQIRRILDDFVRYNQDLQAQIEDTRATGKNRIRAILDDDQKRRFEKICSEVQR
jgi:hypothetical protein